MWHVLHRHKRLEAISIILSQPAAETMTRNAREAKEFSPLHVSTRVCKIRHAINTVALPNVHLSTSEETTPSLENAAYS